MPPVHYRPGAFPPDDRIDWKRVVPLLGPAHEVLARYDCAVRNIRHPELALALIEMRATAQTAQLSGIDISVSDLCDWEDENRPASPQRILEMEEINNHGRAAASFAPVMQEGGPISQNVLREAHKRLMQGPSGAQKTPGAYRRVQTWIGPPGGSSRDATYVPIAPAALPEAMNAWEAYLQSMTRDPLVQLAVLFAELHALQPFLGGNGRIARMLVPWFLWQLDFSSGPCCFFSDVFHANRDEYEERMLAVSRDDDWTNWCRLFLRGLIVQMGAHLIMTDELYNTHLRQLEQLRYYSRAADARLALDWTFRNPYFRASRYADGTGIPPRRARRLFDRMCTTRILVPHNEASDPAERIFTNLDVTQIIEDPPRLDHD